ncbi:hypothetical protein FB567DRAFT_529248 [Paraphoma chrysanthemicola]|uniref:Uncharacterized protein n=1 Tax=Paraphoma chrysanthemicola TaxID=798071 RepID=A0A8K0VXF9_9PLEO|nr:hypothetical protein FB567DRAFT_529248 [Paraphoma chrysanthemicola]
MSSVAANHLLSLTSAPTAATTVEFSHRAMPSASDHVTIFIGEENDFIFARSTAASNTTLHRYRDGKVFETFKDLTNDVGHKLQRYENEGRY